jgi:recombinational DNA repair ATPase RecF
VSSQTGPLPVGSGVPSEQPVKIKKLEIVGFKSFVDRTVINFDHDVTGIVGPNGCGKSNVVDAIKWVQGEQSASRLRGKAMDDVIFNGCESRGPMGSPRSRSPSPTTTAWLRRSTASTPRSRSPGASIARARATTASMAPPCA